MIGQGRKKIIIDKEINRNTILDILIEAWKYHLENIRDMKYLIDYYKGQQDIQKRVSNYSSGIDNKVTVNYAYSSIRDLVGYTFGKPTQIIQRKTKYKKDIEKIADIMEYENSSTIDNEVATMAAITGIGYLCTLPTDELFSDYMPDIPIKINSLDILSTFVVQSAKMGNPVVLSCTYYTDKINTYFLCFTDNEIYRITCKGKNTLSSNAELIDVDINPIGLNPIIMVQNNAFLMGDFETAISVLNALNQIASDSVNDIENVIKSLLVIINAELDSKTTEKVKKNRILEIVGNIGSNVDAKFIYQQLDSMGVQNLREYFEEAYKTIIGIPDRKTRSGGGGDTGDAVKLRDGWADIEIVARIKESYFRIAKKKQISVILSILKKLNLINQSLKTEDMDVKFSRNKNDNLQSKSQSYATLIGTKTITPEDALTIADMTTDSVEIAVKGKKYWEDEEKRVAESQNNTNNQVNQGIVTE